MNVAWRRAESGPLWGHPARGRARGGRASRPVAPREREDTTLNELLPFVVSGIATGSIYGLAGTGLVLTYKTSGIFNFGYGALASVAAYVFYFLHVDHGWDWRLSFVVSVFVVGPLLGL